MMCVLVCCGLQVPWCEQEEGALGGQGDAQQEVGIQVRSAVLGATDRTAHCLHVSFVCWHQQQSNGCSWATPHNNSCWSA